MVINALNIVYSFSPAGLLVKTIHYPSVTLNRKWISTPGKMLALLQRVRNPLKMIKIFLASV